MHDELKPAEHSVLMVDADADLSRDMNAFFDKVDCVKFTAVHTLPGGLAMAGFRQYDIIVLDLQFPELNHMDDALAGQGWVIRGFRDTSPKAKFIIYTASDDEKLIHEHLIKYGVASYFKKDQVTPIALLKKIRELLGFDAFEL